MADSFTRRLKAELAQIKPHRAVVRRALLAGLLRPGSMVKEGAGGAILLTGFDHPAVARLAVHLLRQEGVPKPDLLRRANRRHGRFALHLPDLGAAAPWLGMLGLGLDLLPLPRQLTATSARRGALLRGYLLACGSINDPHKEPHLEFVYAQPQLALETADLLGSLGIDARRTERRGRFLVYLKSRRQVTALLAAVGGKGALFAFEDVWAISELKDHVNRLVNAETANLQRSARAASRQLLAIQTLQIEGRLDRFGAAVRDAAAARLADPEATLSELGHALHITKSAAAARLARLIQAAGLEPEDENR